MLHRQRSEGGKTDVYHTDTSVSENTSCDVSLSSHRDGLWRVGSADLHHDLIILVKVDASLVVGKNGVLIFREAWWHIRDPWS